MSKVSSKLGCSSRFSLFSLLNIHWLCSTSTCRKFRTSMQDLVLDPEWGEIVRIGVVIRICFEVGATK